MMLGAVLQLGIQELIHIDGIINRDMYEYILAETLAASARVTHWPQMDKGLLSQIIWNI